MFTMEVVVVVVVVVVVEVWDVEEAVMVEMALGVVAVASMEVTVCPIDLRHLAHR